jgi:hypothetical protein
MVFSLRAIPCLFVAAQLLGINSAQSQSYPLRYARLLTSEEIREVLNIPPPPIPQSVSVQRISLFTTRLHRLNFDVVLRKLIPKLQAFSQGI